jgi:hypothetical protein
MQADFWHKLWADYQIGFHENTVNPLFAAKGRFAVTDCVRNTGPARQGHLCCAAAILSNIAT